MTSRRCVPGRVDSAKNTMYTTIGCIFICSGSCEGEVLQTSYLDLYKYLRAIIIRLLIVVTRLVVYQEVSFTPFEVVKKLFRIDHVPRLLNKDSLPEQHPKLGQILNNDLIFYLLKHFCKCVYSS